MVCFRLFRRPLENALRKKARLFETGETESATSSGEAKSSRNGYLRPAGPPPQGQNLTLLPAAAGGSLTEN